MKKKQGAGGAKTPEGIPNYQRRTELLARHWSTPYSKLPKQLKPHADEIVKGLPQWDSLSAEERASLSQQYDDQHDPAGQELADADMSNGFEIVMARRNGATAVRLGYLRGRSKDINQRDYIAAIKLDRGQEVHGFQWPDKADDEIPMTTFVLFLKQHSDNIPDTHPLRRALPTTTVPSEHYDLVLSIRSHNFPMTINGAYQYARNQCITMRNPSRAVADVVTSPVAVDEAKVRSDNAKAAIKARWEVTGNPARKSMEDAWASGSYANKDECAEDMAPKLNRAFSTLRGYLKGA